jgi:hypothetical protein
MPTKNEVVIETAMRCGAGFASTCSALGTTTTLIDAQARDQGTDANFAAGGWIYRPDATDDTDKVRRISSEGFDPDTGTWTPTRAWTVAPADDEVYQVYAILPPVVQPGMAESWDRLVNRGLNATWFEDQITVGGGDGSSIRRFPISDETGWVPNEQHVKGVLFRYTDSDGLITDRDQSKGGRYWDIQHTSGDATLILGRAPRADEDVVVVVVRTYPELEDDDDETSCPLTLAVLRARYELYCYLDATPQSQGQYTGEMARSLADWNAEYRQHRPGGSVVFA